MASTNARIQVSVSRSPLRSRFRSRMDAWCRGRSPLPRALFLGWLAYIGCRHLADTEYMSLFYWLNFGIHEVGHVITRPFLPHTLYVAAGTIFQYVVPVIGIVMFLKQKDMFAALPVSGAWIATNLYHTAWYVADARTQRHPSLPIFGEPTSSDWTYLLGKMDLLHWDTRISSVLYVLAFLFMWASIAFGTWMVWVMYRLEAEERRPSGWLK